MKDIESMIGRCQRRFSRISKNYDDLQKFLDFIGIMNNDDIDFIKNGFDEDDTEDLRILLSKLLNAANALTDAVSDAEAISDRVAELKRKKNESSYREGRLRISESNNGKKYLVTINYVDADQEWQDEHIEVDEYNEDSAIYAAKMEFLDTHPELDWKDIKFCNVRIYQ